MTPNLKNRIVCTLAVFLLASTSALGQTPLDSRFTYQGELKQAGAAFDGMADFDFSLWDAGVLGN